MEDEADTTRVEADTAPAAPLSTASLPTLSRYVPLELIGRGGMGTVWTAHDEILQRQVVIKILLCDSDERARARFLDEAQVTGNLDHPGIVPVYDAGHLPDGRLFYAMRRIHGRTLRAVLREGPSLHRALHLFHQLCLTVAYAHDQGVTHRDLKPTNVMVGGYGEVYVADWGLALSTHNERRTVDGERMGTPGYMAPEQVRGDSVYVGPSSDVWSLGVILFELLTLRPAFAGEHSMALMYQVAFSEIPDPRELAVPERKVPDAMAELCAAAMIRDAAQRTLTAREMAERTEAFLDQVEEGRLRQARADALIGEAQAAARGYYQACEDAALARGEARSTGSALVPDAGRHARTALWRKQQEAAQLDLDAGEHYASAVALAQQALGQQDRAEAHALLAELYWARTEEARARKDTAGEAYYAALVRQHDEGRFAQRLDPRGALDVEVVGVAAELSLLRQRAFGPLLVDEPCAHEGDLEAGSYVLRVEAEGRMTVRIPFIVDGRPRPPILVSPPPLFEGSEDFVYVHGGRVRVGDDPAAVDPLPPKEVEVAPFLLGRTPVTMAGYVEFLNALGPEAARPHRPRSSDGSVGYLDFDVGSGAYAMPATDRDGDPWDPLMPALLISWHDAQAYCAWRSESTGVRHRLPTEFEWEAAARGADGRYFPWGNGFDPGLCRVAESVRGRPRPVAVGRYDLDRAPCGAQDMAGLIVEWTATRVPGAEERYVQRGAAFTSPPSWARAASRRTQFADWNTAAYGFRVLRELGERP